MRTTQGTLLVSLVTSIGLSIGACGGDVRVAGNSICDGVEQPSEDGVDQPFDADGDGYFDASNTNCAESYDAAVLDCDDDNSEVHPGATEVECAPLTPSPSRLVP